MTSCIVHHYLESTPLPSLLPPLVRILSLPEKHCHEQHMYPALPQYDPHNCTGFPFILLSLRLQFLLCFFSRSLLICTCTSITPLLPLFLSTLYAFDLAINTPRHSAPWHRTISSPRSRHAHASQRTIITGCRTALASVCSPLFTYNTLPDRTKTPR